MEFLENIKAVQGIVNIRSDDAEDVITSAGADLTSYAPKGNPSFTATASGITKSMAGLSNVNNASELHSM